jgi:hypothetical protein
MNCTQVFEWNVQFRADQKRRDRWRVKSRACLPFLLLHQGDFFHRIHPYRLNSQNYTLLYVKMCKDVALNFDNKRTGCCIMATYCLTLPFFTRERMTKNNMTIILVPCKFSVSPIQDKIERPQFWHNRATAMQTSMFP